MAYKWRSEDNFRGLILSFHMLSGIELRTPGLLPNTFIC